MKKHHDHEEDHPQVHDESNWLVSYADMMTLLFGFFVLMYSMSRVDTDQFAVVSRDVAKFFGGKVKEDKGIVVAVKDVKDMMQTFMKDMEGKGAVSKDEGESLAGNPREADGSEDELPQVPPDRTVEVEQKVNTLTLKFRGSILFGSGSAELKPDFARVLADLGAKLKATGRVQEIRVEGHTDDNPIRSSVFPTNWELSSSRAARIVRQFEKTGIESKGLIAEGLGSSRPEFPNRNEGGQPIRENQAKNRRVVVVVKFAPLTKETREILDTDFEKRKREAAAAAAAGVGAGGVAGSAAGLPVGETNFASSGEGSQEPAPQTPAEVEAAIKDTQDRLATAKVELKKKEEEAKKQRKLAELQEKLNELNRKAKEVETQLKGGGGADSAPAAGDKAPASVQ